MVEGDRGDHKMIEKIEKIVEQMAKERMEHERKFHETKRLSRGNQRQLGKQMESFQKERQKYFQRRKVREQTL